jgi:hypothetical protein
MMILFASFGSEQRARLVLQQLVVRVQELAAFALLAPIGGAVEGAWHVA